MFTPGACSRARVRDARLQSDCQTLIVIQKNLAKLMVVVSQQQYNYLAIIWQSQVKVYFSFLPSEIKVDIAFRSIIQAWMMLTSMMMTQSMSKADWMLAWAEDQRRLCT